MRFCLGDLPRTISSLSLGLRQRIAISALGRNGLERQCPECPLSRQRMETLRMGGRLNSLTKITSAKAKIPRMEISPASTVASEY